MEMEQRELTKKHGEIQKSSSLKPKPKLTLNGKNKQHRFKNQSPERSKKSYNKIYCWTCGLYKGDAELCLSCSRAKNSKILIIN